MQVRQYVNRNNTEPCTCGRVHTVPIEVIEIDDDYLSLLESFLVSKGMKRILIVSDANTHGVAGYDVVHRFTQRVSLGNEFTRAGIVARGQAVPSAQDQGFDEVSNYIFADPMHLAPDKAAVAEVLREISAIEADVVVGVGSGVVNDITRYATFSQGIPYVIVATAPSMDGYASTVAAMQFDGVKVTEPAHAPVGIFTSPAILGAAPRDLIQSGFGDLVGKVISLLDWKLSHVLYGEYFCEQAYRMVWEKLQFCVTHAAELTCADEDVTSALFSGLIDSGIAMAMVGNSRPASGSEHHCSHFWDFLAYVGERPHTSHGIQVGYATHWMMDVYEKSFGGRFDGRNLILQEPRIPVVTDEVRREISACFGVGSGDVIRQQELKQTWLEAHHPAWPHTRDEATARAHRLMEAFRSEFALFPGIRRALLCMGVPHTVGFLEVNHDMLKRTLHYANLLRARYTIFDFLKGQGRFERVLQTVIEDAPYEE